MFAKGKGFKICKTIHTQTFGAWGFFLVDEKMSLVSHCHVKNCCEFFFLQKS